MVGDVQNIAKQAGLQVRDQWCDAECMYCKMTTLYPTLFFSTNKCRVIYDGCRLSWISGIEELGTVKYAGVDLGDMIGPMAVTLDSRKVAVNK